MYYPKSQIKPNIYTNGGDYILSTTKENYIGYYYEISTGQKYTGKNPQDGANILLTLQNPNPIPPQNIVFPNLIYIETQDELSGGSYNQSPPTRLIPSFNPTLPTPQDQQNGQFTRYFCKKNNEILYLEIDKDTHDKLRSRNTQIAWDLYTPISLLWQIKGNKEQVYSSNRASAIAIEQNLKWSGFSQYFQDRFLKYYVEPLTISNLYTSGGEFKTKNGQEYIGFYHIHNSTIPMVGKNHIKEFHETLIPIKPTITSPTSSIIPFQSNNNPYNTGGSISGGGSSGGGGGY